MTDLVTLQVKRGTISEWISNNPILAQGEFGFESDSGKLKIGDGITGWNSLAYVSAVSTVDGSIKLGKNAGLSGQGRNSVALGSNAGEILQGYSSANDGNALGVTGYSIAIGYKAGQSSQRNESIAIGEEAGNTNQGAYSVAVGLKSGRNNQGEGSIAIGLNTAYENQGERSVAIGYASGSNQNDYCIAIGNDTARTEQGAYSIAIGHKAGSGITYSPQAANTIILNASGQPLSGNRGVTGAFYVSPIRQDVTKRIPLSYDPVTSEIVQGVTYTWLQPSSSFTQLFTTASGGPSQTSDLSIGSLDDARYFLDCLPLDNAGFPTIFTPKNKSLSTIIEKRGQSVYGGTTTFIDINNYITVSSHPTSPATIRLTVVSSSSPEKFAINLWKINY